MSRVDNSKGENIQSESDDERYQMLVTSCVIVCTWFIDWSEAIWSSVARLDENLWKKPRDRRVVEKQKPTNKSNQIKTTIFLISTKSKDGDGGGRGISNVTILP